MSALELRRQRNALIEQMHDLTEATSFPAEAQRRWKDLDAQQKDLETRIRREETNALGEEMRRVNAPPQAQPCGDLAVYAGLRSAAPQQTTYSESRELRPFLNDLGSDEYRTAFDSYLRRGAEGINSTQRNLLTDITHEVRTYSGLNTSTSGDAAGYSVPIGFQREIEIKMKAFGQMRNACRIETTATGNLLDWPTMDDTSNEAEEVAEANPVSQLNPGFGQVQFSSFLESSKQVLVSVQILQDSAFNLEALLAEAFGRRIGRRVNKKYTVGTGSGEPQGLITAILADSVPNVIDATGSQSNDGDNTHTEANSIGSDDLDNLIAAVDPAYRPNASFMMNWKTIDYLRKVKDRYGRPLWNAGLASGTPDTIFGFRFFWNDSMDLIGAGKYPVLFGDFSKHLIRDVGGIQVMRFNELFMSNHQIGFQAWLRTDSRRLQSSAFSLLRNPLS